MEGAYLIKEQCASCRFLPDSRSLAFGSCERPFLVPEQVGCGKFLRQQAAIHGYEWLPARLLLACIFSAMKHSLNGLTLGVSLPLSNRKYTSRLLIIPAMRPAASWMVCAWRIRLSASSCCSIACMRCSKWISFSVKRLRRVSICAGRK